MNERRRHSRVPANLLVQHLAGAGEYQVDYSTDLSRGGLFIRTGRTAKVGDGLTVQFAPAKDGRLVQAFCRVARVTGEGIAAEFLRLDEGSAEVLKGTLRN
ncbi:MAG: PilZ domain-containing protein [Myxococcales bacterium]|nr:PilZ domain-containing protein [Myxococcales bacterium]